MYYKSAFVVLVLTSLILMLYACSLNENNEDNTPPRNLTSVEKSIVSADNSFGLNLFDKLSKAKPNSNLFFFFYRH